MGLTKTKLRLCIVPRSATLPYGAESPTYKIHYPTTRFERHAEGSRRKDSCTRGYKERWCRYLDTKIHKASARSEKTSPTRPTACGAHEHEAAR
eukprot:IDg8737t1